MQDFNFFEPYLSKGRQQSATVVHYGLFLLIFAFLLAAWPLFNLGYGIWLQRQTASLEVQVTGSEKYPLLAQADQEKAAVAQMQAELGGLSKTDEALQAGEWLTEPFLFSLLSTVPKDVKLDSLSVQEGQKVALTGTASGKPAIAELAYNIRATDRFEGIYVSTISNKDGTYSFDMSFGLKGGESK